MAAIRTIFNQPTANECSAQLDKMAAMLGRQFPKVEQMLTEAKADLLAFSAFPQPHWRKLWSTNAVRHEALIESGGDETREAGGGL